MATLNLLEYLKSLRSSLQAVGPKTHLCLVVGNESVDCDSVVSSLVYAHYHRSKRLSSNSDSDEGDYVTLPLLQCLREEVNLHQEVMFLLDMLYIDVSELLFLNDVSPEFLLGVGKLSLILVDHYVLTGIMVPFSSDVIEIIDHHQKSENYLVGHEGIISTLELAGSCSSLITKKILQESDYMIEEPTATLLLSAILSDTGNLKATARMTITDEKAVEDLIKIVPSFNREDHFARLFRARYDMSQFSTQQILQNDYKECIIGGRYSVGFSTITTLLPSFLSQSDIKDSLKEFYSIHKLDAYILLGVSIPNPDLSNIQKHIAVYQPETINNEFSESIVSLLEANDDLKCKRAELIINFEGVLLEQSDINFSRKQILPIITSFIESIETEFPRSGVSPSGVNINDFEDSNSAAVIGVKEEQAFPLEPTVFILSSKKSVEDHSSPTGEVPTGLVPKGRKQANPGAIPEYSSTEECKERRSHRYVSVDGDETTISMDMVNPYRKIIQHAGYIGETRQALVVISACHLPPRSLINYNHVIHHTFYYVLSVLDKLIVDNYTIVYFHSGAPRNSMPSLSIINRFYQMINRRIRKQLTQLYIVHPTFWVKTMLRLSRPFVSKKFWRKVHFVPTLQDLSADISLDSDYISPPIVAMEKLLMSQKLARQKYIAKEEQNTTDQNSEHMLETVTSGEDKMSNVEEIK